MPSSADQPPSSPSGNGPAGLGQMSSLSSECTPLKQRYDLCFNKWFEEYLSLGVSSQASSSNASSTSLSSSSPQSSSSSSSGGFWGRGRSSSSSSSAAQVDDLERSEKRKQLRTDLDGTCGAVFREYQACVKKALGDRNILPLISEAREFNPFPFPDSSADANGRPNNEPFPFPAASSEERQSWERKNGW